MRLRRGVGVSDFWRWLVEQGVGHQPVLNAERLTATELCVALSRGPQESAVICNARYLLPTMPQR
jgi:hypothetical protein